MKTIIAGSREQTNYNLVLQAIKDCGFRVTEVVSGGARGVDKLGERWAEENSIPCEEFKPDWKNIKHPDAVVKKGAYGEYDCTAGFRRNQAMADYAEAAIIIKENTSGTEDMLEKANQCGLRVYVLDLTKTDIFYEF